MSNKNKITSILTKGVDSIKGFLKGSFKYLTVLMAFGVTNTVDNYAEANAASQGTSDVTTFATAADITFTGTTAITTLADDDIVDSMVNTNNSNLVWTFSGGNDLTITNALAVTAGESLTINMSGTGTEISLGEAATEASGGSIIFNLGAGAIVEVTAADTHVFATDGSAAGQGTLTVTETTTFSDTMGSTNGLATINIATSKTGTFSEAAKATTINAIGTGTFLKAVTATSIVQDGTVNIKNTATAAIAGAFTESAGGDITVLNVLNSADTEAPSVATFSGAITIDTVAVGATNIGGAATFSSDVAAGTALNIVGGDHTSEDSVVTTSADITAGAIVMTSAGDGSAGLTSSGSSAHTITGTINGAGTITTGNAAGTTFASAIGASTQVTEIAVTAAKISTFNSTVDAATLDVDGTTTLMVGGNTIGEFELATTGTLIIDKGITNGSTMWTSSTQSDTGIAAGKIYLPGNLTTGQTLLIADSNLGNAVDTDMATAIQDNALTDYTTSGEATTLTITATDKTEAAIATSLSLSKEEARAILQVRNSTGLIGDSTLSQFFSDALNGLNSETVAGATNLAKHASPQEDLSAGSLASTRAMTGSVQSVISNRMASLRSGDAFVSGMTAGDSVSANSAFMQAIGSVTEQKNTKSGGTTVHGYDSETTGIALGFDVITDNGSVLGLSISAAETEVDGLGDGKSQNDIDSYTASIYMDKTGDNGFVEASLTVGINEHQSSRQVNAGNVTRTYTSKYDSEQVSLRLKGGVPKELGASSYITPFASITATAIETEGHSESSTAASDGLRLKQEQDDVGSTVGSVGFKIHSVTDSGIPMMSLALNNEFGDTSISTTNTYLGGGSAFKTTTDIEPLSATLGLGYTFGSDGATLNIGYEAEVNDDDYFSHFGTIKLVGKF
jgi:hypothetical protein